VVSEILVKVSSSRVVQLLLVGTSATAAVYARTAVGPLQETIRRALAFNDNQMAMLQGFAVALPVIIAVIPLGLLVDRFSRVRLLFIFTLLNLIGSVLTACASSFALLFAARCLVGLTATATVTAAYSLLADLCSETQRGRATMLLAVGQYGAMSAAFALGGMLLAVIGTGPNAWRWAMLYLITPLIPVVLSILAMREPLRAESVLTQPSMRDIGAVLWRYRAVVGPLLMGVVLAEVPLGAALTWGAPALARGFDLPPDRVGAIMAVGLLVSGVVGPVVGGTLADIGQRFGGPGRTLSVLSGLALLVIPASLFGYVSDATLASILLIVFLAIGSAMGVMGTTLFTIAIPNELRGLCIAALFSLCLFFSVGLAPVMVSLLSDAMGGPTMVGKALAIVGAIASILASATFAFGKRYVHV
jgi:MFS family permease